jgi:hypothetical protein
MPDRPVAVIACTQVVRQKVAVPEQLSARRGEQQRIGGRASVVVEMLLNLSDDVAGQDDAALAGGSLGCAKSAAWPRASVSFPKASRAWTARL